MVVRSVRPVGQAVQPLVATAVDPAVHGLTEFAVSFRDLGHRYTGVGLQDEQSIHVDERS
jgi:hypothetical protein